MNKYKALAIKALSNMMGDNYERARISFRNCTPKQMQEMYGESGKTRAQILADYKAHDLKVEKAILWVKSQKD